MKKSIHRKIILICDNDRLHHAQAVQEWLQTKHKVLATLFAGTKPYGTYLEMAPPPGNP